MAKEKLYGSIKDRLLEQGLQTHLINGVAIPLNPNWNKVAINLSGGADSAMLTYLLATIIQEKNYKCKIDVITYKRCWKTRPWQGDVSLNVYNWLKNRFPNIIDNRETTYIPPELEHGVVGNIVGDRSPDQVLISSFNSYLAFYNKYNAVYNATTQNPTVDFDIKDRMCNRDNVTHDLKTLAYIKHEGISWCLEPLRLIEKDWIVQQYKNYDIMDFFNVTRSCEGDYKNENLLGIDYTYYSIAKDSIELKECGLCFWCVERKWALERLNNK